MEVVKSNGEKVDTSKINSVMKPRVARSEKFHENTNGIAERWRKCQKMKK